MDNNTKLAVGVGIAAISILLLTKQANAEPPPPIGILDAKLVNGRVWLKFEVTTTNPAAGAIMIMWQPLPEGTPYGWMGLPLPLTNGHVSSDENLVWGNGEYVMLSRFYTGQPNGEIVMTSPHKIAINIDLRDNLINLGTLAQYDRKEIVV